MDSEVIRVIYEYTKQGRVRFKKHALIRIVERNIKINEIEGVLQNLKIIATYAEDKPLTSYLTLGFTKNKRPLHIVVALDKVEKYIWIISVYEPDKTKWNETFTKRLER